jgi:hypothetical protein
MSAKVAAGIRAREAARHPKPVVAPKPSRSARQRAIEIEIDRAPDRVFVNEPDEIAEDEFSGELPE